MNIVNDLRQSVYLGKMTIFPVRFLQRTRKCLTADLVVLCHVHSMPPRRTAKSWLQNTSPGNDAIGLANI